MKEIKKTFARTLRKEQTPSEQKVWALLRDRKCFGLKFRRQHVVEGFVVDFYCHEYKIAIEIDGRIHLKRKDYDELRQREVEAKNVTFIRVANEEIERDEDIVLRKIKEVLESSA